MKRRCALVLLVMTAACGETPERPVSGVFEAARSCAAPITPEGRNPDGRHLKEGRRFRAVAVAGDPPSRYRVAVKRAEETACRWVDAACGAFTPSQPPVRRAHTLALSWQPAFCESRTGQGKAECKSQTPQRPDAGRLSLHGLWPQHDDYCGVPAETVCLDHDPSRWPELPKVDLTPALRSRLEAWMPGAAAHESARGPKTSAFHLHEWWKHGTCYDGDAQRYFDRSLDYLAQVDAGAFGALLKARLADGGAIAPEEAYQAVERDFGPAARDRVLFTCWDLKDDGRYFFGEIWLSLDGEADPEASVKTLIQTAPPLTRRSSHECDRPFIVDPAGLQ